MGQCSQADEAVAKAMIESVGGSFSIDGAGHAVQVDLRNCWLTDVDVHQLGALTALQDLDLSYTKISDQALEGLASLENVRSLNLRYAEYISDIGIAHLKHWQNAEYLNVHGTKVTSSVFEHIASWHRLKFLDVAHSRVSDELFESLSDLNRLESFAFGGNKMSGTALPLLKSLPSLRALDVGSSQRTDSGLWSVSITDANVSNLAQLVWLEDLRLNETTLSNRGLATLAASLRELHTLDLSETRISSSGLAALSALPKLRILKITGLPGIDESAAERLLDLRQLEVLDLTLSNIGAAGVAKLSGHPNLKRLFLGGVDLTQEQLEAMRRAMPDCEISWWAAPTIAATED
ncbi:MAG: hypothetical protein KDB22_04000 [Planctomycetales bacterium]|nr:hypothetical protein [Planctomycetales bacterium]